MRVVSIAVGAAVLGSSPAAHAGDAASGKLVFSQCSACHSVIPNTRDSMGPNLFGIVGRKAGGKAGFVYSDAMRNSGLVWSEANLKKFVMDPMNVVPASNMFFTGIRNATQADDLVAYLAALK